jgi:hypothetical protein
MKDERVASEEELIRHVTGTGTIFTSREQSRIFPQMTATSAAISSVIWIALPSAHQ